MTKIEKMVQETYGGVESTPRTSQGNGIFESFNCWDTKCLHVAQSWKLKQSETKDEELLKTLASSLQYTVTDSSFSGCGEDSDTSCNVVGRNNDLLMVAALKTKDSGKILTVSLERL